MPPNSRLELHHLSTKLGPRRHMRLFFLGFVTLLAAACSGGANNFECSGNAGCDLSGGGMCVAAPTGRNWCAYPDPACPGGYRYSDQNVGDGLSGECVMEGTDAGVDAPTIDAAPREWGAPTPVANVNSTGDERQPGISADGLELYFWRGSLNPPYGEVYVATRTSSTQPFGTPVAVTAVNTPGNENGVVLSRSGLELFVSQGNEIMISTRASAAAAWSTPVTTGLIAFYFSVSSDGYSLYTVKGCPVGQHSGSGPCLFRSVRTAIGSPWSTPTFIEWPGGSIQWNSAHVSGDGLRLLLSDPYSGTAIRAAQATRATTSAPWGSPQVIDALSLESTNGALRWNADETEIYLTAKPISPPVGGYDIYVSVLR